MLIFKCNNQKAVIDYLVNKLSDIVKSHELKTLAFDYFDDDLEERIKELIEINSEGFVFDEKDEIGEEPYGYVSLFFETFLALLRSLKKEFPSIGIEGYFFVNDIGCAEYVCRQGVYTSEEWNDIKFIDQLQCVVCHEWINAADAFKILREDELEFDVNGEDSEEWLYPSGYHTNGTEGEFCVCSKKCEEKLTKNEEI